MFSKLADSLGSVADKKMNALMSRTCSINCIYISWPNFSYLSKKSSTIVVFVESIPTTCHEDARSHDLHRSILAGLCIGSNRYTLQPLLTDQSSPLGSHTTNKGTSFLTALQHESIQ